MKECPTCHRTFDDGINFCPNCGIPLTVPGTPTGGFEAGSSYRQADGGQYSGQYQQNNQYRQTGQYQQNGPYQQAGQYQQNGQYGEPVNSGGQTDPKTVGIISYITLIGFIVALCIGDKKNPYVRFHLNQSLMICICSLLVLFIPRIGWLINMGCLAAAIYGLVGACQGKMNKIPVIGDVEIIK